jgi:hypothetical protein
MNRVSFSSSRRFENDRDRRSWKTGLGHDMGGFALVFLGQNAHVGKYAVWGERAI